MRVNKRPRVLVVEDSPTLARMAVLFLKHYEIDVDTAANGKEAAEAIMAREYDLVLMDISMPVMDGIECTRTVRRLEKDLNRYTTIIAITASDTRNRCMAAGMDGYVTKPARYIQIIETWLPQVRKTG